MRISWNWLSEMVDLTGVGGPQGLAELLTRRGLEVEAVESQGAGLEKVVTAKILERAPHPQADRLSLCKVSMGSGEPLEIVCGAQNMKAGDTVALAQVGANLPNGMKIAAGKIRGVLSNGMLCSEEELGFQKKSDGILILPETTKLGVGLAEVLGRSDSHLTLKVTANRADCLSHWGIAREVASALGQKPKRESPPELDFRNSPIAVHLEAGELAPQFFGCYIEGVKIGPSPDWLVQRLEGLGSRSINNVVDATNLVMFELGQPVHAYDADLIEGKVIGVRLAKAGEELALLDGKTVKLSGTELVIADSSRAVGLAGVMGGGNSEVQETTTRVFLECAEFAPTSVRRASTQHQRKTDAAHRFERGVDPAGVAFAITRLAQIVTLLGGGKIIGSVAALKPSRKLEGGAESREIRMATGFCADFLGIQLSEAECQRVLESHDCVVCREGSDFVVKAPSFRLDLSIPEDLAEEVARSVGYDRIPSIVPALTTPPTATVANASGMRGALINRAKDMLVQQGFVETLNFAFTSGRWLKECGLESKVKVVNPLSEEHEVLVPSLLPGVISNVLHNWNHHFGSEALPLRIFELRPTFHLEPGAESGAKAQGESETGVQERWKLSLALTGPRASGGLRSDQNESDFFDLKGVVENLLEALGARGVRFSPLSASRSPIEGVSALFHPGQSVEILAGNQVAGVMGLVHPARAKAWKARTPLLLAEMDWEAISRLCRPAGDTRAYKAWPEFPSMERDFAILTRTDVSADKITQVALKAGRPIAKVAKIFDIYRGSQVAEGMTSVAVRVIFWDESRSLQEVETETASKQILEAWKKELGAELRG